MNKMNPPLLEVVDYSLKLQGSDGLVLPVLQNISFSVYPGKCLGIAGESGSGKSVMAMSIAGLINPAIIAHKSGVILFQKQNRINLSDLSDNTLRKIRGRDIGFIFQEPVSAMNPLMTIYEQIAEPVYEHMPELKQQQVKKLVFEAMSEAGFPEPASVCNKYPYQLSGGMCQRAMIAMARVLSPALVIADEPTTAIDAGIQVQLLNNLRKDMKENMRSLIFISHDLGVIRAISDHLAIFYCGYLLEIGKASDVLSRPAHPYTSDLLAALPRLVKDRVLPEAVKGAMPSLAEHASKCIYSDRCKKVRNKCTTKMPDYKTITDDRKVCCYYPLSD